MVCTLVAALTLMPGLNARAAGGVVTNCSNDAQFNSLLPNGGTITFNCGSALINLSSTKTISDDTTIDGGGQITLSGANTRQLFVVSGGAALTLRNIVLTNGSSSLDGGAIYNDGELILENTTIRDSRATASGGAIVSYGLLTISNSLLEGNRAVNGGALYPRWAGSRTTIINSALRDNHATDMNNGWGGAILVWDGAPVTIANSDISGNTAGYGGGIYNFANSVLTLQSNTLLRDNHAYTSGGGLYNEGTANLVHATLSGNSTANAGGGLFNSATVTLTNVTLSSNRTNNDGGGMWNSGTAVLINVTLSGNSATDAGGGLMNVNSVGRYAILDRVTLSGNSAGGGGGIWNSGSATLVKVTLTGNSATNDGGGLTNHNIATLENVTFSGNWAVRYGGGLINFNGTASLSHVTFNGNFATVVGGGIYRDGGLVSVRHSIMANSLPGGGCVGAVTNGGFNLASDTSCPFTYIQNVMLGPLADNGGPTKTHMPLPDGPARDFVAVGCPPPPTDQRGAARPVGAACDAGAVEYGAMLPRVYLPIVLK